jgi:potassium efflux system protein
MTHRSTTTARWLWLAVFSLLWTSPATAQDSQTDPVSTAMAALAQASLDVQAADRMLDTRLDEDGQRDLKTRLAAVRKTATENADTLQAQVALVDARVAELGAVTAGVAEAPDIAAQRKSLAQQRSTIDSAIKRGKLLAIEATQIEDELDATIAARRGRRLAQQLPSLVTPSFWSPLIEAVPSDTARVAALGRTGIATALTGAQGRRGWLAFLGLLVAIVVLGPVRLRLRAIGRQYAIDNVPGHRVRRSGFALWRLAIGTATPGLAALAFAWGLRAADMVDGRWEPIVAALVPATFVAAFVTALAGALLLRHQASWRLLPIDDNLADALRPWSWWLAALALVDPLLLAMNDAVRASRAAHTAADTAEAVVTLAVAIGVLVTIARKRRAARAALEAEGAEPVSGFAHPTTALVVLVVSAATIAAAIAILGGYIGLALWLMRSVIFWPAIVIGALYILLTVADDVATSLFAASSGPGILIGRSIGIRPSAIDQFGVLLSGALRLTLVILGLGAILTPFGTGFDSFFTQLGTLSDGLTIGQVTISPGAVLRALLVFGVGLALARGFLGWLNKRYLPTTELDDSARNSVALVARYIGILIAVLWGLAALGIGLERIALLLSALSVGIGFGLQAITQNFVSGLILLAERPVKIGDLIRIGADEGDVKRISVRSTEIVLGDHSTLIVPNSKLITETVLNKTLSNALGRIQILFTVPLNTDPVPVREIVLQAFADNAAILAEPAPVVFLDGIVDGRIAFNCMAHVAGPRDAYPARSGVLMQILQRFVAEGIDIGTPATRMELIDGKLPDPKS